jgi:hypothetical protein
MLVRASAHEILIPSAGNALPDLSNMPSLKYRIKLIDSHQVIRKKVDRYFEPLYDELRSDWQKDLLLSVASNFVYKVALSINHEAFVDIPMITQMPSFLEELNNSINGDEAQFRLAQIYGLWNLYDIKNTVPALTYVPESIGPEMYQRVNDMLDEASMIHLSQQKHMMGIPGKLKAALLEFRKGIRNMRRDPVYKDKFNFTSDLMRFSGQLVGFLEPGTGGIVSSAGELLSKFANPRPKYNPPLVDLDTSRLEFSKKSDPRQDLVIMDSIGTRTRNSKTGLWKLSKQL